MMFRINDPIWRSNFMQLDSSFKDEFDSLMKPFVFGFEEKDDYYVCCFNITEGFTEDNITVISDDETKIITLTTEGIVEGTTFKTYNRTTIPDNADINTLEALLDKNKLYITIKKMQKEGN